MADALDSELTIPLVYRPPSGDGWLTTTEGVVMNVEVWIELLVVLLKIVAAGQLGFGN